MTDHDPLDDRVRRALSREAEQVRPDPDGLYKIRDRVAAQKPSRRPWLYTVTGAGVAAAAAVGLFVMLDRDPTQTADPGVAGVPTSASQLPSTTVSPDKPTPAPTTPARKPTQAQASKPQTAGVRAVPVYWLGKTVGRADAGLRLYRSFVRVKDADPALGAVTLMSSGQPDDPDYQTAWSGARPRSVARSGGVITVDFDALPGKPVSPGDSAAAVQQLVYTVQGTLEARDPVRVTLKGGPAGRLFGQVDTAAPFPRAAQLDVQAFVWILTPAEQTTTTSPVTVTGIASTFEATVNWRVRDLGSKKVIAESFTTATRGSGEFGTFRFTVRLPSGKYLLECLESSAEDGRDTNTDTKTLVVR